MAFASSRQWLERIKLLLYGNSRWLVVSVILAVAALLYANTLQNDWNYDDFPVVVENPDIRSLSNFIKDAYAGRPLREFTYLLDFQLFGTVPAGYHLQNILWHAANGLLTFYLALRLGAVRPVAWLAALLFLAHPVQVEVVASTAHRKDSLACFFLLLALLAYSRFIEKDRRCWLFCAATVLCFLLALGAKQTAYALPLFLLVYECSLVPVERRFLLAAPRLVAAVLACGSIAGAAWISFNGGWERYLAAAQGHLVRQNYFVDGAGEILPYHLAALLKSWVFLLGKLVWPSDLALEYTFVLPTSPVDPWLLAAVLLLVAYAVGLVLAWRRREKLLLFALLFAGITWLPTSNLWPLSYYAADRYLYLPSVGVFLGAAELFVRIGLKRPVVAGAVAVPCIVLLSVLTVRQGQVWRTSETLWRHAVQVNPTSAYALNNLGMVNYEAGDLRGAFRYFRESATVNPLNAEALYNLGFLSERFGEPQQAISYYRRFLSLKDPQLEKQRMELRRHLVQHYGIKD